VTPINSQSTPPGVPQPKTNKLAIASLFLGILALVLCVVGVVFAIPGLICGFMGMKRVKNSAGLEKGHGLALTGTIMNGAALVLFPIIGLLAAIAIPNFVKAREAAQRNACVSNLKAIDGAKMVWALENKKEQTDTPVDADLFGTGKAVRAKPVCPVGGIYTINSVDTKPTCTVRGHQF
jgi:competence protein ComGC